jgi:hypothetical protein
VDRGVEAFLIRATDKEDAGVLHARRFLALHDGLKKIGPVREMFE